MKKSRCRPREDDVKTCLQNGHERSLRTLVGLLDDEGVALLASLWFSEAAATPDSSSEAELGDSINQAHNDDGI